MIQQQLVILISSIKINDCYVHRVKSDIKQEKDGKELNEL